MLLVSVSSSFPHLNNTEMPIMPTWGVSNTSSGDSVILISDVFVLCIPGYAKSQANRIQDQLIFFEKLKIDNVSIFVLPEFGNKVI